VRPFHALEPLRRAGTNHRALQVRAAE
jgi:hypothetical protein